MVTAKCNMFIAIISNMLFLQQPPVWEVCVINTWINKGGHSVQEFDINIFANSSQAFCIVRVDLDEGGKPFSYTPVFFNQALMNLVRVEEGRTIEEQCPMLFQNMNPRWLRIFYNAAYENHKSEIEDISEEYGRYIRVQCFSAGLGYCACIVNDISKQMLTERFKSELYANISHEIRTPMNAIAGMLSLMYIHLEEPDKLEQYLEKIADYGDELLNILDKVLDMSQIELGKVTLADQLFDMTEMIEYVAAQLQPESTAKRQQVKIISDGLVHKKVVGDRGRIQQILQYLMENSVKFTPEQGMITVTLTERAAQDGKSCYVMEVKDNGMGIEPEFMEYLYEPFCRSERVKKAHIPGCGLGLKIVNSIVKMMRGSIDVETDIQHGTSVTVMIELPYMDE
ncbi:sensor histidine kinase [Clostridium sp. AM49-4BH]|nr:sensor histidine kinase [Clostridium sp. AM49-4BH]